MELFTIKDGKLTFSSSYGLEQSVFDVTVSEDKQTLTVHPAIAKGEYGQRWIMMGGMMRATSQLSGSTHKMKSSQPSKMLHSLYLTMDWSVMMASSLLSILWPTLLLLITPKEPLA